MLACDPPALPRRRACRLTAGASLRLCCFLRLPAHWEGWISSGRGRSLAHQQGHMDSGARQVDTRKSPERRGTPTSSAAPLSSGAASSPHFLFPISHLDCRQIGYVQPPRIAPRLSVRKGVQRVISPQPTPALPLPPVSPPSPALLATRQQHKSR